MPLTSLAVRDPAHEVPVHSAPVQAAPAHDPQDAPHVVTDRFGPVDDPDEETVADNVAPEDEPTTVRPTPASPELVRWEAAAKTEGPRPRRIGKYELSTRLARGAFGVVYTAHDASLERNVALKVLRPTHLANMDVVQRFLREARATARIAHPGIVTILDCGMVETRRGTTAFIAMELLSGESLTSRLGRSGRLDPRPACEIVRQVASALEAAHHVDVLHRDLKPDNIYIVPDPAMPSGERVKVLDFGLAKLGDGGQTQLQTVFGTPRYMSPEQSRSATQIDHRSDIYSLGCILFELVTGRTPFDGDVRQLLERHQRATPPRAAALVPEVPPVLDQLIAEMLAKDPMDRPQTMGAVQRALRIALDGPSAPRPRSDPAPPLALPLPPVEPTALPVRPPSSPPVRLGSSPPHPGPPIRPARPSSSPPVAMSLGQGPLLPSVEISMTPMPPALKPAPVVEPVIGPVIGRGIEPVIDPAIDDDPAPLDLAAVSGEVVVPAVPQPPPTPDTQPQPSRVRRDPLVALCLLVIAVITAVALAAAA